MRNPIANYFSNNMGIPTMSMPQMMNMNMMNPIGMGMDMGMNTNLIISKPGQT